MKGKKEKCDDGGEIQGLGQVWKQPARKVWRSSRSFVDECSHKVSSAAGPKSERTVSQRPTGRTNGTCTTICLALTKEIYDLCSQSFINCATRRRCSCWYIPALYRCAYPLSPRTKEP